MKNKITINTTVGRTDGFIAADMDGEKVMLNIEKGNYYGLDNIGSHIWELIEKPQAVYAIVAILLKEYDVQEEQCQGDVLSFLEKTYQEGLITLA